MLTLKVNGGWWQFTDALKNRTPFKTGGSLHSGQPGMVGTFGRLPYSYRESLSRADYAVYSYATPIAWHEAVADVWVTPDVKYSVTTSKHQGRIFTAISQLSA